MILRKRKKSIDSVVTQLDPSVVIENPDMKIETKKGQQFAIADIATLFDDIKHIKKDKLKAHKELEKLKTLKEETFETLKKYKSIKESDIKELNSKEKELRQLYQKIVNEIESTSQAKVNRMIEDSVDKLDSFKASLAGLFKENEGKFAEIIKESKEETVSFRKEVSSEFVEIKKIIDEASHRRKALKKELEKDLFDIKYTLQTEKNIVLDAIFENIKLAKENIDKDIAPIISSVEEQIKELNKVARIDIQGYLNQINVEKTAVTEDIQKRIKEVQYNSELVMQDIIQTTRTELKKVKQGQADELKSYKTQVFKDATKVFREIEDRAQLLKKALGEEIGAVIETANQTVQQAKKDAQFDVDRLKKEALLDKEALVEVVTREIKGLKVDFRAEIEAIINKSDIRVRSLEKTFEQKTAEIEKGFNQEKIHILKLIQDEVKEVLGSYRHEVRSLIAPAKEEVAELKEEIEKEFKSLKQDLVLEKEAVYKVMHDELNDVKDKMFGEVAVLNDSNEKNLRLLLNKAKSELEVVQDDFRQKKDSIIQSILLQFEEFKQQGKIEGMAIESKTTVKIEEAKREMLAHMSDMKIEIFNELDLVKNNVNLIIQYLKNSKD